MADYVMEMGLFAIVTVIADADSETVVYFQVYRFSH